MEALHSLINAGNDLVWGQLLIYILIGVGLFFTVRMGFMQIRLLPRGWQEMLGGRGHNSISCQPRGSRRICMKPMRTVKNRPTPIRI